MSDFLELTTNSLLAKIAPQPDDQRRFIVLVGYVLVDEASKSDTPSVRVYLELDLRTYLEVQIGDVVWAEKAIPGQESSPTKLVINAAAKVNRVTTAARHVETEFLGGIIASSCLPTAASGSAVNVWINQDTVTATGCPPPGGGVLSRTAGGNSACFHTGVCVSDPILPY
jgi:hypothetical protein